MPRWEQSQLGCVAPHLILTLSQGCTVWASEWVAHTNVCKTADGASVSNLQDWASIGNLGWIRVCLLCTDWCAWNCGDKGKAKSLPTGFSAFYPPLDPLSSRLTSCQRCYRDDTWQTWMCCAWQAATTPRSLYADPLDVASLSAPLIVLPVDKQTHVDWLLTWLKRSFGALLLLTPTHQNVTEYRRVASESLITVQVEEITQAMLNK